MYQLEKKDFHKVAELFLSLSINHLQIISILEGNTKGSVFTDNPETPTIAVVWERQEEGEAYLAGKPNHTFLQEFNREMKTIIQKERNEDFCDLTLYWDENFTENHLQVFFSGFHPLQQKRFQYKIGKTGDLKPVAIPKFLKLCKITDSFIKKDYKNRHDLIEWTVVENHHSFFREHGYGMCLLDTKEKELISWCCFDYFSGSRAEIGIETSEKHRNKGFAAMLISNVVAFLFEQGYDEIGWHCWNTNIGSLKTAEKVGFQRVFEKPVLSLIFNEFDNYAHNAHVYFDEKQDFQKAAFYYEKCVIMFQENHPEMRESIFLAETGLPMNHFLVSAALAWANCDEKYKTFEKLNQIKVQNKTKFLDWISTIQALKKYHKSDEWRNFQNKFK